DFFGVPVPPDMQGQPLWRTIADDAPVREAALFGVFGGQVNVTDARYVYMRGAPDGTDAPLYNYSLMPMHMRARFSVDELRNHELAAPFAFTKGVRPLRIAAKSFPGARMFGTLLFDLEADPAQDRPILDDAAELRMANLLVERMRANDAPSE